jgi:hypothetical protein
MTTTIKWVLLSIMFAVVSIMLYIAIDSTWSAEHGTGVLTTIGFFLAATACILCAFKAVDSSGHLTGEQ